MLKAAATDIMARLSQMPWFTAVLSLRLIEALVFYGVVTALWVFILTRLPLNRAYPFALLGAAFVPPMAYFAFGETVGIRYMLGLALILAGLAVLYVKP